MTTSVPFPATLRSEWTKLRTSRATLVTALAAAVVTLALTALHCANAPRGPIDAVGASLFGITVAQFIAGVCGALAVTNEYSSGTIRIALVATPRRARLFTGKTALLTAVALGYGAVVAITSLTLGQTLLTAPLTDTADLLLTTRRVAGAAVVLAAITLLGLGCGYLTRHSAGAIVATLAILTLPKLLTDALPGTIREHVLPYTPLSAADSLMSLPQSGNLPPLAALATLATEVAALLALALLTFTRRDA